VLVYRDEDEDILIRQIRRFAEALGALFRGGSPSSYDVDELVRESLGLRLSTIDALPAEVLFSLGSDSDDRWLDRVELMAMVLEQLAEQEAASAEGRRWKAARLRQLAGRGA
jgi:hypothetical protein